MSVKSFIALGPDVNNRKRDVTLMLLRINKLECLSVTSLSKPSLKLKGIHKRTYSGAHFGFFSLILFEILD
jgi:hypothetical protein